MTSAPMQACGAAILSLINLTRDSYNALLRSAFLIQSQNFNLNRIAAEMLKSAEQIFQNRQRKQ
jgi:hypothetical protein